MTNEPIKTYKPKPEIRQRGVLYNGTNFDQIREFTNGLAHKVKPNGHEYLVVESRSGPVRVDIGDTVLCGPAGAFYKITPDALEIKYDEAEEE